MTLVDVHSRGGGLLRLRYHFDPEQGCFVIGIETTGAWSNGDSISEIGAVKVRNHEAVGRCGRRHSVSCVRRDLYRQCSAHL
ncbi:hypothetical protein ACVWZM_001896 [Bradyrhizobium sp. USDA 4501]